jgi:hypothetical protein
VFIYEQTIAWTRILFISRRIIRHRRLNPTLHKYLGQFVRSYVVLISAISRYPEFEKKVKKERDVEGGGGRRRKKKKKKRGR